MDPKDTGRYLTQATATRGPAAIPAREAGSPSNPVPAVAAAPAQGPYLGGADGEGRHRISFSVVGGSVRNLRVDGRAMAPYTEIVDGRVETHHLGFVLTATWVDDRHVEGHVKMRGRWGRGVSFRFQARHRHGDILSGS